MVLCRSLCYINHVHRVLGFCLLVTTGCQTDASGIASAAMNYERPEFFAAPFPSEDLRNEDGTFDLGAFPRGNGSALVEDLVALASARDGFGMTSGIFFRLDAPPRLERLPSVETSLTADARVFLMNVGPDSPDRGERHPIEVRFQTEGGPYGTPMQLSLLPVPGLPLRARDPYAAVVMTDIGSSAGESPAPSTAMIDLRAGRDPAGMSAEVAELYRDALNVLDEEEVPLTGIMAMTVFRTGDARETIMRVRTAARAIGPMLIEPPTQAAVHEGFCVYEGTVRVPVFQSGTPPYTDGGGDFEFDDAGVPIEQRSEDAKLVITVPRAAMPEGGFPFVVMLRPGVGGDRPLADWGRRATLDGSPDPGTGPGQTFAAAGFAGVSVDAPLIGSRNPTGGDEQFLVYNVTNLRGTIDTLRQAAVEVSLTIDLLETLTLGASDCDGLSSVEFNAETVAVFGHSTGATVTPMAVAADPRIGAVILSGAGGSWIENIVHKLKPLAVRPLIEALLGHTTVGVTMTEHDAVLSLLQWAGEGADPSTYAEGLVAADPSARTARPHVLMLQGIVDRYILPPIANPTTLAFDLDLGGSALDRDHEELSDFDSILDVLPLRGGTQTLLPITGNRENNDVTAVLVQHAEDGVHDGHEVVFQCAGPRQQYESFLRTFAMGVPTVGPTTVDCVP